MQVGLTQASSEDRPAASATSEDTGPRAGEAGALRSKESTQRPPGSRAAAATELVDTGWQPRPDDRWQLLLSQT